MAPAWTGVAGRRVVLTGATGGIGLAAAEALARRGAELTLVARSPARAEQAVARCRAAGAAQVDVLQADLALQASVRALAAELLARYPAVHVLVNNAGAINSRRSLTPDGFELTWAVNHLAPFLLTNLLLERLGSSAPARVITTSSDAHKGAVLPLDDPNAEHGYHGFRRYGQTKLANICFTAELGRRLDGSGVTAVCFHPGLVATGFNRNNGPAMRAAMTLVRPFARTPERGARTLVWLTEAPEAALSQGGYYVDERLTAPSPAALELEAQSQLWALSEAETGLQPPLAEPPAGR